MGHEGNIASVLNHAPNLDSVQCSTKFPPTARSCKTALAKRAETAKRNESSNRHAPSVGDRVAAVDVGAMVGAAATAVGARGNSQCSGCIQREGYELSRSHNGWPTRPDTSNTGASGTLPWEPVGNPSRVHSMHGTGRDALLLPVVGSCFTWAWSPRPCGTVFPRRATKISSQGTPNIPPMLALLLHR